MSSNDGYDPMSQGSYSPPQLDLPEVVPECIGPYKIECFLQKGGMGLLYLGTDPHTKEPCTIKVLNPRFLTQPEMVSRFLREAEILAQTDHPHIVKLHGWGSWEGGYYIALEFVQGISLRQNILQTPLSLRRAIELIIEIAYAVCHLHVHGIIHRDLKPENILISEAGNVKIIDFGIAQLLEEKEISPSVGARFIGTPIYISPEQQRNPDDVSYPSDIYSLGIIAYEIILGKLSLGQIHLSFMPKGIQRILAKALQPNWQDRYQDIVDFIADLASYLHSSKLEKERHSTDKLSELNENLRNVQKLLHPPPQHVQWGEIGLSLHNVWKGSELFHVQRMDSNELILLIGEVIAPAPEAAMRASAIQGMAFVMLDREKTPKKIVSYMNELLCKSVDQAPISLACLRLSAIENSLQYVSCGYGSLWLLSKGSEAPLHLPSDDSTIGISPQMEMRQLAHPWSYGDVLILVPSFSQFKEAGVEAFLNDAIAHTKDFSPQKQAEAVLRKLKAVYPKSFQEGSLAVFVIRRNV